MRYLSATEAARIIGVSDRTISTWIREGKLTAHRPSKNRLAIPENEVEAMARERRHYHVNVPDAIEIAQRLAGLERKIEELSSLVQRCDNLEQKYEKVQKLLTERPAIPTVTSSLESQPKRTYSAERDLPEGCILAREFARQHGVAPETFRDYYTKGLGPEKDKAHVSSRPKPGREKEREWFLTPEQQAAALDFWKRHGVPYQTPQPDSQEKPAAEERAWYLPDGE